MNRTIWGTSFQVNGKKVLKGISVFPNSILIYHLNGEWDTFSAILSADINPHSALKINEYEGGKIQFAVYGDEQEIFLSRTMDVTTNPQKVNIPIRGVQKLKLVVRTQDWLPYFAQCGNWINAKLERK